MLRCPKCLSTYTDAGKICRSCGAILDEVTEDESAAVKLKHEAAAAEWIQEAAPQELNQTTVPAALMSADAGCPADEWICPGCGEACPNNFAVCWNCGIDSQDASILQHPQRSGAVEAIQTAEPDPMVGSLHRPPICAEKDFVAVRCAVCGSERIIPEVPVLDRGDGSPGHLQVMIYGDPDALIFKDRRFETCTASICGDCGHMELRVQNARELYDHYLRSRQ
jgi:hypothetical protein